MSYNIEQKKAAVDILNSHGGLTTAAISAVRELLDAPGLSKSTLHGWLKSHSGSESGERTKPKSEPKSEPKQVSMAVVERADELTDRQWAFVQQYILCGFVGVQAAARAGYTGSYQTLAVTASDLLRNPKVRSEIDKRMAQMAMGADEVLALLAEHAHANLYDFLSNTGEIDIKQARRRGKLHLVKEYTVTTRILEDGSIERKTSLKLHDAQSALGMLAKHHKLLVDRVQVDDWRSEAIELIKSGELEYDVVEEEFGVDLATQLFESAGIPISR